MNGRFHDTAKHAHEPGDHQEHDTKGTCTPNKTPPSPAPSCGCSRKTQNAKNGDQSVEAESGGESAPPLISSNDLPFQSLVFSDLTHAQVTDLDAYRVVLIYKDPAEALVSRYFYNHCRNLRGADCGGSESTFPSLATCVAPKVACAAVSKVSEFSALMASVIVRKRPSNLACVRLSPVCGQATRHGGSEHYQCVFGQFLRYDVLCVQKLACTEIRGGEHQETNIVGACSGCAPVVMGRKICFSLHLLSVVCVETKYRWRYCCSAAVGGGRRRHSSARSARFVAEHVTRTSRLPALSPVR